MLDALQLGRQLTKTQMRKVRGGTEGGEPELPTESSGSCCVHANNWSGYQCGLSMATAKDFQQNGGWDKWCCSSCIESASQYPGTPVFGIPVN